MKEVVFKQERNDFIMCCKDQELAVYICDKPFKEAKKFFELQNFPKWQLEKEIKSDLM